MADPDLYTLALTAPVPAAALAAPLTVRCLAAFPDTPATRAHLYTLVRQGVLDTPGHSGDFPDQCFFDTHIFGPSYRAEADTQVLALDGDAWVGLSSLRRTETPGRSSFGLTAVQPAYRGRGIARTLKMHALHLASARGDHTVTTEVHPLNTAMVRVNAHLGFVRADAGAFH